ncbi:MAG TPA: S-layer homology domain-containing protein [Thermoanaerobaculia bacterium]|nr:S-layer homology domain-containing protein [Thermoanaerobaculia bacterium]
MRTVRILAMLVAALAAAGRALARPADAPQTWGTTNPAYVSVAEWQFSPSSSAVAFSDFGNPARRYSLTPDAYFLASPSLPPGALLQSLEFDFCNTQPDGGSSILLQLYSATAVNFDFTLLTQITGTANQGCTSTFVDLTGLNYTTDDVQRRLILEAVFGPNADSTTSFSGAVVGYRLQVSPAPASPQFADVPVTDPAFQYIEALAASGITSGCGGGNFCPDTAVTRRQMAVFLAKALGLQWP